MENEATQEQQNCRHTNGLPLGFFGHHELVETLGPRPNAARRRRAPRRRSGVNFVRDTLLEFIAALTFTCMWSFRFGSRAGIGLQLRPAVSSLPIEVSILLILTKYCDKYRLDLEDEGRRARHVAPLQSGKVVHRLQEGP